MQRVPFQPPQPTLPPTHHPPHTHTEGGMIKDGSSIVTPHEVNESELLVVHTDKYLKSLTVSHMTVMWSTTYPIVYNQESMNKASLIVSIKNQSFFGGDISIVCIV